MLASVAGDLAAWFAAVGTVGTLAWLVFEFVRREHARQRDQFRAQASKVSYWPVIDDAGNVGFIVRNTGELPVYDAVLVSSDVGFSASTNLVIGVLPPGDTYRSVPAEAVGDPAKVRGLLREKAQVLSKGLGFTDGDGVRWVRDPSGSLGEREIKWLEPHEAQILRAIYALSDDGERAAEVAAIAARAGLPSRPATLALEDLRHRGLVRVGVERPGETWWRLTAAGAANARSLEAD